MSSDVRVICIIFFLLCIRTEVIPNEVKDFMDSVRVYNLFVYNFSV